MKNFSRRYVRSNLPKRSSFPTFSLPPLSHLAKLTEGQGGSVGRTREKGRKGTLRTFITVGPALTHPCYHYGLRYHTPALVPLRICTVTYCNGWRKNNGDGTPNGEGGEGRRGGVGFYFLSDNRRTCAIIPFPLVKDRVSF